MEEFELLKHFPEKLRKVFDEKPEMICPITQELFVEPVFVDGYTFEKSAILTWFGKSQLNPITKNQVSHSQRQERNLRINYDKKSTVAAFKSKILKKVQKYFDEYYGKMSMSDGEERERIVKLLEKLIERGKEMEPKNSKVLSNALKYYETMMKVSPNRIRVFQRKREVYFKNYIESLLDKKKFENALESVSKEPDFENSPKLLNEYIRILKLSGPENEQKVLDFSVMLVNLWIGKRKYRKAMGILTERSFKHNIHTLVLLKNSIYPNMKSAKKGTGGLVTMPSHLVRELAGLFFQEGQYESALMEILSLPRDKPSGRNLLIQELIEMKRQLRGVESSEEIKKKNISIICLELSKLYLSKDDSSRASLERAMKTLREGHEADEGSLPILKSLYETTYRYQETYLKDKLRNYEQLLSQNMRNNETIKRDSSRMRIENTRLRSQNESLRTIIEKMKVDGVEKKNQEDQKLPPRVVDTSSHNNTESISQITSVKRTPSSMMMSKTGKGVVIWSNYICDECRSQPIIGPRYESVDDNEDYDLCEECYLAGRGQGGKVRTFKVFLRKDDTKGAIAKKGGGKDLMDPGFDEEDKLKKLREMGFHTDQSKLRSLVRKHKGNLIVVVKELLKFKKR